MNVLREANPIDSEFERTLDQYSPYLGNGARQEVSYYYSRMEVA